MVTTKKTKKKDKSTLNFKKLKSKKSVCTHCTKCCIHVNQEIFGPETDDDCDYIIWFLLHENVTVWIDKDGYWFVEFKTPCKPLKNKRCTIYKKRPSVCRNYSQDNCLNKFGYDKKVHFNTPEQFLKYLKKINYKYKGFYK
jgi:Fe-S-cluster containining protein